MLKYSKVELGYIHNHDQLNIIRSGIRDEGDIGVKVVVDMIYPKHLHKLHNAYPLAPV
jgi:hypothetical protein